MISYKNLKILLAKREISGKQFRELANISQSTYTKINKNLPIHLNTVDKICTALNCQISDVVEHI